MAKTWSVWSPQPRSSGITVRVLSSFSLEITEAETFEQVGGVTTFCQIVLNTSTEDVRRALIQMGWKPPISEDLPD